MSSGFDIDTPYTWGYYNELSPIYLNFVCALNGHHPIPLDDGFSYCELGCGYGVTTNGLAELFPQGDFIGIDYNDEVATVHMRCETRLVFSTEDCGYLR